MPKFNTVAAEAAYAVTLHSAHTDDFGDVTDYGRWHALVNVSAALLASLEEPTDLVERFRAVYGDQTLTVWVSEDSQGFVDVFTSGEGPIQARTVESRFREEEARYYDWAREFDDA